MTRLGDLLDFGQLSKAFVKINLSKSPTFLGNCCKGVKIYNFSSEIIFANFYTLLAIFSGHTAGGALHWQYVSYIYSIAAA